MTAPLPHNSLIADSLQEAIVHHQAGRLMEAEELYRAILQVMPNEPDANHNLGLLAVQVGQAVAGLPFLKAALAIDPAQGQYALSYAGALLATGQAKEALAIIQAAIGNGFDTAAANELRQHADAALGENAVLSADASDRTPPAQTESAAATAPESILARQRDGRIGKSAKKGKSPQTIPRAKRSLPQRECDHLAALFNAGHFAELENLTGSLIEQYADSGFVWKARWASLHLQGKEALHALQMSIKLLPRDIELHNNYGNALMDLGRLDDAAASYRRALKINGAYAEAHANLGNALCGLGQFDEALRSYRRALKINPGYAEAHHNLGSALASLGQLASAQASYRRALAIKPDFVAAHNNLGIILKRLGQPAEAAACHRRALDIAPDSAESLSNLGNALYGLGQPEEAIACYRRALAINPNLAETHSNLGVALMDLGQVDAALAAYRSALAIKPDYADAHNNVGTALKESGQPAAAVASYQRALAINPDYAAAHSGLGNALLALGEVDEAVVSCRRALAIEPDLAIAHVNLGYAQQCLGQLNQSVVSYRRAIAAQADFAEAYSNLGNALKALGQLAAAVASYRQALAIKPNLCAAHSNLLFCLSQDESVDAPSLFAEHRRFAEQFEAPLRADWLPHSNPPDPDRCLRVGFVSGDLRSHALANFIEPVLARLADSTQLSLHAYSNHAVDDAVTERIRTHLAHWHAIAGWSDVVLAQQIRSDGIDILIDLSGHTALHRLLTFARKPAPVQISWMGYPGTTGLVAMDYYLADHFFLPPGQFDDRFTEKIVQMPASAPFQPYKEAPPVNALPAQRNGYLTFGSFNSTNKLSHSVISLWAKLLCAVPDSRMLLGGMPQDGDFDTLIEWFAQEGVARDRLSFHQRCGIDAYLALHQQVDICLDTFPYNGGTTTLHALWMGVPTLTLAGDTAAGRSGASILGHAGLDAFVAHSKEEFVERGVRWAGHLAALADIRDGLRIRLGQSAAVQPEIVAEALERTLRIVWRRWCAGLAPVSFELPLQPSGETQAGTER